jgi:hypothetical protein
LRPSDTYKNNPRRCAKRKNRRPSRSVSPWDRRAIIAAGAGLSPDERSHWKKTVLASDDPLDRAVAVLWL